MSFSDVGNDSEVGIRNLAKLSNFARMVGAHFNNSDLGIGVHLQQSQRHANVVVQVALRRRYLVFLLKHGNDQFFGGGFSIRPGDAQHRNA